MDTGEAILIGGGVVLGGLLLWKLTARAPSSSPPPGYAPRPPAPAPTTLQSAEHLVEKYTGVPITEVGHLAESTPTWLQVAVPVIGLNSLIQQTIDNPGGTLREIGHKAEQAGEYIVDKAADIGKSAIHYATLGLV